MRATARVTIMAVVPLAASLSLPAAAQESRWEQAIQCAGAMSTAAEFTANQESVRDLHNSFVSLRDSATRLVEVAAPARGLTIERARAAIAARAQEARARVLAAEPARRQSAFFSVMEAEMANCRKLSDAARGEGRIR